MANPHEYRLRATQPGKEMGWLTIIDGEVEWHESDRLALKVAQTALDDAKAEGYTVSVFVCQALRQNGEAP